MWLLLSFGKYQLASVSASEVAKRLLSENCTDTDWLLSSYLVRTIQTLTVRGRSTWLISACSTYKPPYVVYMRLINHTLTNQITVFPVAAL